LGTKNVHTVHDGDGWATRREGTGRVSKKFSTKHAAEKAGREAAKRDHVEHLVHNRDGKISERNSYGPDPYPPRG
jgi:ketosteroid isomerase-like protein